MTEPKSMNDFLLDFQKLLSVDNAVTSETLLESLPEWDSMAIMVCIAYFQETFGVRTRFKQYGALRTVGDVADLAGRPLP